MQHLSLTRSPISFKITLRHLVTFLISLAILMALQVANAGTTGTEFQGLHTLLNNWATGYLGKSLALAAFLLGAGMGLAKSTAMPAIMGLIFAIVFSIGPGVIDGMLTATI